MEINYGYYLFKNDLQKLMDLIKTLQEDKFDKQWLFYLVHLIYDYNINN